MAARRGDRPRPRHDDHGVRQPATTRAHLYLTYRFDRDTTLAILAGFAHNRRDDPRPPRPASRPISSRSRPAEQLALASREPRQPHQPHRPDRQGRHPRGCRTTASRRVSRPGRCNPVAICFDEDDAGRPDVMFVIQRNPPDGSAYVARPEQGYGDRIPVSTANTVGLWRHDRPLPRHRADQPRPDGPLVDGGDAGLCRTIPRRRSCWPSTRTT